MKVAVGILLWNRGITVTIYFVWLRSREGSSAVSVQVRDLTRLGYGRNVYQCAGSLNHQAGTTQSSASVSLLNNAKNKEAIITLRDNVRGRIRE